jgi:hypothetical protein
MKKNQRPKISCYGTFKELSKKQPWEGAKNNLITLLTKYLISVTTNEATSKGRLGQVEKYGQLITHFLSLTKPF